MLDPVKTIELYQKPPSPQSFAAGDVIFSQGEPGKFIFGVLEGVVEIWVNGKRVETIHQGDVFGEGAIVHLDHTRTSTAIAKTACQLVFLDRTHFLFVVQQTPMFALQVMRSYSDRLRRLRSPASEE
jgi:CRP-like cAMP-binding protein